METSLIIQRLDAQSESLEIVQELLKSILDRLDKAEAAIAWLENENV